MKLCIAEAAALLPLLPLHTSTHVLHICADSTGPVQADLVAAVQAVRARV
jgi:hypothetical protein